MSDHDTVEYCFVRVGQIYRELVLAGTVHEEAVGVGSDPTFSSPNLVRRFLDGPPEPSAPILRQIAAVREGAILIGEYDDVILEHVLQTSEKSHGRIFGASPSLREEGTEKRILVL